MKILSHMKSCQLFLHFSLNLPQGDPNWQIPRITHCFLFIVDGIKAQVLGGMLTFLSLGLLLLIMDVKLRLNELSFII